MTFLIKNNFRSCALDLTFIEIIKSDYKIYIFINNNNKL